MSILNKFHVKDRVALVTGCSRGIGKAMAIALAEAGANIIGVSSSLEKSGSDVENAVKELGRDFTAFTCDFSNRTSLHDFIADVKKKFSVIDILVNNVGTVQRSSILEHTDKQWDQVIEVNQTAPFILAREIGKDMVARGNGKIVFIASMLTFQGGITVPSYAASKGAVGQMTKAFANEWASKGVNVNAIAPGYIRTDLTEELRNTPDRSESILSRIPAGRWGNPEDLAGSLLFLCSDSSNYVHGSILVVDGGWMGR